MLQLCVCVCVDGVYLQPGVFIRGALSVGHSSVSFSRALPLRGMFGFCASQSWTVCSHGGERLMAFVVEPRRDGFLRRSGMCERNV